MYSVLFQDLRTSNSQRILKINIEMFLFDDELCVSVYFKKIHKNFPMPFESVLTPPAEPCADFEGG